ncbi:MAG: Rrf2 family transcriptional regulator [Spirochaetales bacterium]|nr:Rrf2 family transcriptional regulator [Spirochaetales bacterium]
MKLSTKSEYSLLALIYLARHDREEEFVRIQDICDTYDISKKYLEMLFSVLRQNRYIQTKRGAEGGYRLAKNASDISLAEVIRLMDGALAPTESVSRYFYSDTPIRQEEKILAVFEDLRNIIAEKMESIHLSDLI